MHQYDLCKHEHHPKRDAKNPPEITNKLVAIVKSRWLKQAELKKFHNLFLFFRKQREKNEKITNL